MPSPPSGHGGWDVEGGYRGLGTGGNFNAPGGTGVENYGGYSTNMPSPGGYDTNMPSPGDGQGGAGGGGRQDMPMPQGIMQLLQMLRGGGMGTQGGGMQQGGGMDGNNALYRALASLFGG